jgi:phage terminase small subunit
MARKLTERQQKFLNALFADANGNIKDAKIIAGYSPSTNNQEIIQSLKEEILEATQIYMASNAPKAAMAMVGGLYDPTELGIKDKMAAAKELLDRTGLIKTEKVQVESSGGVMLMPAKQVVKEEDE